MQRVPQLCWVCSLDNDKADGCHDEARLLWTAVMTGEVTADRTPPLGG